MHLLVAVGMRRRLGPPRRTRGRRAERQAKPVGFQHRPACAPSSLPRAKEPTIARASTAAYGCFDRAGASPPPQGPRLKGRRTRRGVREKVNGPRQEMLCASPCKMLSSLSRPPPRPPLPPPPRHLSVSQWQPMTASNFSQSCDEDADARGRTCGACSPGKASALADGHGDEPPIQFVFRDQFIGLMDIAAESAPMPTPVNALFASAR